MGTVRDEGLQGSQQAEEAEGAVEEDSREVSREGPATCLFSVEIREEIVLSEGRLQCSLPSGKCGFQSSLGL